MTLNEGIAILLGVAIGLWLRRNRPHAVVRLDVVGATHCSVQGREGTSITTRFVCPKCETTAPAIQTMGAPN